MLKGIFEEAELFNIGFNKSQNKVSSFFNFGSYGDLGALTELEYKDGAVTMQGGPYESSNFEDNKIVIRPGLLRLLRTGQPYASIDTVSRNEAIITVKIPDSVQNLPVGTLYRDNNGFVKIVQ